MANEGRNALAELAERLNNGYVSLVVNGRQMATFTTAAFPELEKAQRIIAKLAKVAPAIHRSGKSLMYTLEERLAVMDAVDYCRAVAEEGETK